MNPKSISGETQLMLQVKSGDQRAFAQLFERFHRPVLAYVTWMLGGASAGAGAEEVTQEVFLKVYRARESYEPTAKFTTWLWTIAKNTTLTHLRDTRDQRTLESSLTGGEDDDETIDLEDTGRLNPAQWAELGERQARLRDSIAALPRTQKEALLLVVEGGLSYQEVAQTLGSTESAVKSLLVRARRTLEETYGKEFKVS